MNDFLCLCSNAETMAGSRRWSNDQKGPYAMDSRTYYYMDMAFYCNKTELTAVSRTQFGKYFARENTVIYSDNVQCETNYNYS